MLSFGAPPDPAPAPAAPAAKKPQLWKTIVFLGVAWGIWKVAQQRPARTRNPGGGQLLGKARREWERFHWGRPARSARRMRLSRRPDTLVELGKLESVVYSTRKGREPMTHYEHQFAEGGGRRPVLALDPRSRRLHVVGGTYSVGWRGIVG